MKMSNEGNLRIYRRWAPIYDAITGPVFASGRRQALSRLNAQPGESLLIVGVGTGADLPALPAGIAVWGLDLSEEMLAEARRKPFSPGLSLTLLQGDASRLPFDEGSFDAVLLSLILSVVPDGTLALREALRVLRPGGRAVIYDKFMPAGQSISGLRRLMNWFSTRLGTDITRRFEDMLPAEGYRVLIHEAATLGGFYQVIVLERTLSEAIYLPVYKGVIGSTGGQP